MGISLYHAKIVNGDKGVDFVDQFKNLMVDFHGFLILILDGIHMNNRVTVKLTAKLPLNIINGIMKKQNVSGGRNLAVERNHLPPRAIIVDQHVMNA